MDELDFKELDCDELKTVILGNYTVVMLWVDGMNTYVVGATDDDIEFMLSENESSVRSFAYEADAIEYFKYLVNVILDIYMEEDYDNDDESFFYGYTDIPTGLVS